MAVVIGTGAFFLALTIVVNAVSFLVPYWVEWDHATSDGKGLWGRCVCSWAVNDLENYYKGGEDWLKAVQALYAIAIALILFCVLLLMFISCCREKEGGGGMVAVGALLIIAFAMIAASIIVFGIFANRSTEWGQPDVTGSPRLGWGMWLGVAGAIICLIAGIVYISAGRRR